MSLNNFNKSFFNSIAGGIGFNESFCSALSIRPVYSNELQGPEMGMKVEVYNDKGEPVRDQHTELVCELPVPLMPCFY